ncbi:MAG: single-stranded DNA-binding protein [Calditrichaeota bacterium]|nr:single-stranded DNA-binding protein [Calditrichota bacterium]RQW04528.1 MAG: single-stranded DNA-binding protein [Calditrichota bacterium]
MSRGTVNKILIIGRLGADPEVRYAPSGNPVANFNVATNHSYKDRDGNFQEQTDWHRVVAWTRLAEFAKQYLKKGMRVYVEGRLQYREWQDQNGAKRTATEIVANDVQMLDSPGGRTDSAETEKMPKKDLEVPDDIEPTEDDSVPF